MRKFVLICSILVYSFQLNAQHNSDYMQYMFNGLLINPAYAGSSGALNITTLYRNQWMGLPGAPVTAVLSAHSPLKNKKMNLGGILLNDRFGIYNHTHLSLAYAYRIKLSKGNLAFGLQAGIDSYFTDMSKINTTDAADPNFNMSQSRKTGPEAGAGIFYHNDDLYLGLSAPKLLNTDLILDQKQLVILDAGGVVKLNENIRLKPAVLFKYIEGSPLSANVSTTFYYKTSVGVGAGYTYKTSALAYLDLRLNDQLNIGYGYTYALTELRNYSNGSHELMLRYLFRYKINGINPRYF